MKNTIALLAACGLSCLFGPVELAEPAELIGASTPTAVSGRTGTNRTLSKPASDNDTLFGVEISERSDDPCFLKARYRDVATGAETSSLRFAACSDNNNNEGTNSSRKVVILSEGFFVNAVRICLSSDRDKMKGIQLLGTYEDCILGRRPSPYCLRSAPGSSRSAGTSKICAMTTTPALGRSVVTRCR
jgi:hypothetical protein